MCSRRKRVDVFWYNFSTSTMHMPVLCEDSNIRVSSPGIDCSTKGGVEGHRGGATGMSSLGDNQAKETRRRVEVQIPLSRSSTFSPTCHHRHHRPPPTSTSNSLLFNVLPAFANSKPLRLNMATRKILMLHGCVEDPD